MQSTDLNECLLTSFFTNYYFIPPMTTFTIRDKEAGNVIDDFNTIEEAKIALAEYEQDDKDNDCFTTDFYEIVESN